MKKGCCFFSSNFNQTSLDYLQGKVAVVIRSGS